MNSTEIALAIGGLLVLIFLMYISYKREKMDSAENSSSSNEKKLSDSQRKAIISELERAGRGEDINLIEGTILRMQIESPTIEHIADFGQACLKGKLFMLCTSQKETLEDTLIFEKENDAPLLVLCTSKERAEKVWEKAPGHTHLVSLPFAHLVELMPPNLGFIINPYCEAVSFTMPPSKVESLRSVYKSLERERLTEVDENLNTIEKAIIEHNEGINRDREILEALCSIQLHLPCTNEDATQPLIIQGANNEPSVTVCTSERRIKDMGDLRKKVQTVKVIQLAQYLHEIAKPVALIFNPGWKYPFTLPVESVQKIIDATQIDFVTLDSILEEYYSGEKDMVQGHVIQAMMRFMVAIVIKKEDLSNLEYDMARVERDGKTYNCLFSSEKYTALYKEKYPVFIKDAAAQGDALLEQIPEADGIILNAESEREMIFSNGMIHIAKTLPLS